MLSKPMWTSKYLCFNQAYIPNSTTHFGEVIDEVNAALQEVKLNESTILEENFTAHGGTNYVTKKVVIVNVEILMLMQNETTHHNFAATTVYVSLTIRNTFLNTEACKSIYGNERACSSGP